MTQRVYQQWADALRMRFEAAQSEPNVNQAALLEEAREVGRQSPNATASINELADTLGFAGSALRIAFTQGVQEISQTALNKQNEIKGFVQKETGPILTVV